MRAILINPEEQTITEVEYSGDYRNIYDHIQAQSFDGVRIGDENEHTIFVDDEGLLKPNSHFRFDGDNPAYLAGRGLILATEDGESVACTLSIEDVKSKVAFGYPLRVGPKIVFMEDGGMKRFWNIR